MRLRQTVEGATSSLNIGSLAEWATVVVAVLAVAAAIWALRYNKNANDLAELAAAEARRSNDVDSRGVSRRRSHS